MFTVQSCNIIYYWCPCRARYNFDNFRTDTESVWLWIFYFIAILPRSYFTGDLRVYALYSACLRIHARGGAKVRDARQITQAVWLVANRGKRVARADTAEGQLTRNHVLTVIITRCLFAAKHPLHVRDRYRDLIPTDKLGKNKIKSKYALPGTHAKSPLNGRIHTVKTTWSTAIPALGL